MTTSLDAAIAHIAARRPSLIDLGLDRTKAALKALGDPHKRLPPVFHVAGTNGKGSTIAYLKAILEAAGKRVHVFTSPHLVRFNERIVLAGQEISDEALIDVLNRCDQAVDADQLTFFETATVAAFLAYAEHGADYLLLEVGLGGRLDATNVLDHPIATVTTPIALDHQQFLGNDLATIAFEKAGIYRSGVPAVIGPQAPEAMTALVAAAEKIGAKPVVYGTDWQAYPERGRLIYQDLDGLKDLSPPRLIGDHQIANAGLAVATLAAAGVEPDDETISQGLSDARWPARLQRLTKGPLVDLLARSAPAGSELWLDGGHNPHAARALAAALSAIGERANSPLIMITGLQANKDLKGYFDAFEGLAAFVYAVSADKENAASPEAVMKAATSAGLKAVTSISPLEAMERAIAADHGDGDPLRVLICGSLYLAGDILKAHQ